jgi:hypothetical protein
MLFRNLIFLSITLLFPGIKAMDPLPGDMIRVIAKKVIKSQDFTDLEKAFALQSMAGVNKRWFQAMAGLKTQDFPYHF